jgi:hypothetical protein
VCVEGPTTKGGQWVATFIANGVTQTCNIAGSAQVSAVKFTCSVEGYAQAFQATAIAGLGTMGGSYIDAYASSHGTTPLVRSASAAARAFFLAGPL